MKILYCCDGSKVSINAINNLKHFTTKAKVDIICVIDWASLNTCISCPHNEDGQKNCEKRADDILENAKSMLIKDGFEMNSAEQVYGNASAVILEKIKKDKYEFVLMGSHGTKGIKNWLGSVTNAVTQAGEIPVFVSKKEISSNKTLLCVDEDPASYKAVEFFAHHFNSDEISMCSIMEEGGEYAEMFYFDEDFIETIRAEEQKSAQRALEYSSKVLLRHGKTSKNEFILSGNTAEEIIDLIKCENFDLVVLGKHKKTLIDNLFLGSISKRVLDNADCCVLLANYKEEK